MDKLTFPVGCPPLPELLEQLEIRPEHDSSRYDGYTMSRTLKGLPDPGYATGAFAPAVKKYRAYLQKHPQDAAAWEGLAYLHLRIAEGEGKGSGMGAEDLVSPDEAEDPLRAGHGLLSFQSELQALLCQPNNPRFRRRLNTVLSLALTDATREYEGDAFHKGKYAPIVRCLGGVRAAQELRFSIVAGLLELTAESLKSNPLGEAELLDDLAGLKHDMGEYRGAITLYERGLALVQQALAQGEQVFLRDPAYFYLYLHLSALGARDFPLATRYLDLMEEEEQRENAERVKEGKKPLHTEGPATHLRLSLLEAEGKQDEARALALKNADMLQERYLQTPVKERDPWDMLRRAELLHYAGQSKEAEGLLTRTLRGLKGKDAGHPREYGERLLAEIRGQD